MSPPRTTTFETDRKATRTTVGDPMAHVDRHPLTNMPLGGKILATLGLVFGLLLFAASTWFEVFASNWGASLMNFQMWGATFLFLRSGAPRISWALFAVHATC